MLPPPSAPTGVAATPGAGTAAPAAIAHVPRPPQRAAARGAQAQLSRVLVPLERAHFPDRSDVAAVQLPSAPLAYAQLAAYVSQLDRAHDRLAALAGERPAAWRYPEGAPLVPTYDALPAPYRAMAPDLVRIRQTRARRDLARLPDSAKVWHQCLQADGALHAQAPAEAGAKLGKLIDYLGVLNETYGAPYGAATHAATHRANRAAALATGANAAEADSEARGQHARQLRAGQKAAQLVAELSVGRGNWPAFGRALRHYGNFVQLQDAPSYDATPLAPATLHAWIARCPASAFAYVDLWHCGLVNVVDADTFPRLFERLLTTHVPLRRIDRFLADACAHGRTPSAQVATAWNGRHLGATATHEDAADPYVAGKLRQSLFATAWSVDLWPHLPRLLTCAIDVGAPIRGNAAASAAQSPTLAAYVAMAQLAAANDGAGLLALGAKVPATFERPAVGLPWLALLAGHQPPAVLVAALERVALRSADVDPLAVATCRQLLGACLQWGDGASFERVAAVVERAHMHYHRDLAPLLASGRAA